MGRKSAHPWRRHAQARFLGLSSRLSAVHPNHKQIASGAFLIGLLAAGAKLFGALREVAIAWRFGVGATVDAYQLALTVSTWVPMLLSGVFAVVLVPRLVALRSDPERYGSLVSELNGTMILLSLIVALATLWSAPTLVMLLAGDLEQRIQSIATSIALSIAPAAFLTVIAGYLSARLQARQAYAYSFVEAFPAIAICVLIVSAPPQWGHASLVWGTLIGFLLQAICLLWMVKRRDPPIGAIRVAHTVAEWRGLYIAFGTMALGQVLSMAAIPIDQAAAASVGQGAVAVLGYATRITGLITGLGSVVLARALLPVLSGVAASGAHKLGERQTLKWSCLMFLIAAVSLPIAWALAPLGVKVLFERGAFLPRDTEIVTSALRFGLLQLPPFFAGIVLVQWTAVRDHFRHLLIANTAGFIVKVVCNLVLTPVLGIAGIMIGTAVMYSIVALFLLYLLKFRAGNGSDPTPRPA